MIVSIKLPMPPSVNSIWRRGRNKKTGKSVTYLDSKYKKWKDDAMILLAAQHPASIVGHFTAVISLDQSKRGRSDADNRNKAVLDLLEKAGVVENDKLCDSVTACWTDVDGCLVELEAVAANTFEPIGKAAERVVTRIGRQKEKAA